MKLTALALAVALAAGVDESEFRNARHVDAERTGAIVIEPDGAMFEHARVGFADLRVVDAHGNQVPWRALPVDTAGLQRPVRVLNSGREGPYAVALLDLGPRRAAHDRVVLETPDRDFVGRVVVFGADRRDGPFTRLSATGIYDVAGASRARSTTAVFPLIDFRYLRVRATGISRIAGASVARGQARGATVERAAKRISTRQSGSRTIVTLDFDHARVPVDEIRVSARTPRYDRAVVVSVSNDEFGRSFRVVSGGRISRFEGSSPSPIPVGARARYVRVAIENGDDPPLRDVRGRATSRSYALVLEGDHARPYRLLYGAPAVGPPSYEFARIPISGDLVGGTLLPERANPAFAEPEKPFGERHRWLIQVALAVAALAVAAAGFLALRRRA